MSGYSGMQKRKEVSRSAQALSIYELDYANSMSYEYDKIIPIFSCIRGKKRRLQMESKT